MRSRWQAGSQDHDLYYFLLSSLRPDDYNPLNVNTKKNLFVAFLGKNWLNLILILAAIICMVWAGNLLTLPKQTGREIGLATFILAAASSFLSVVTTKMYAKIGFDETLRDHGVQIAKAIRVLQDEMAVLQNWVFQKRAWLRGSPKAADHVDPALEHIEQTLRVCQNMTGTALGGITGVIGDAVAQYESLMEEMSRVRIETSRETAELEEEIETASSSQDLEQLQDRLRQIAREGQEKLSQLVETAGVPAPPEPPKQSFIATCPYCFAKKTTELTLRKGQTEVVICDICRRPFNTHINGALRLVVRPLRRRTLNGEQFTNEVHKFLDVTRSRIEPTQLKALLPIVAAHHATVKERTPYTLQQAIIDNGALAGAGVSNSALRTFFKVVKNGGGFSFEAGTLPNFKARYTNDVSEKSLLRAFLDGTVGLISNIFELTAEHTQLLAKLLLPEAMVDGEDAMAESVALHSKTIHDKGTENSD